MQVSVLFLCFSLLNFYDDSLLKSHTWQAVRGPHLWAVLFCVGRTGASTLMITHSPSSVFHLHRVPDLQRWGNQQSGLSQRLWWAPAPLLSTLAPILCFGLPASRGVTGKARSRLRRARAGTWYLNGSSQGISQDRSPVFACGYPEVCV